MTEELRGKARLDRPELRQEVKLAMLSFAQDFHTFQSIREDVIIKGMDSHPKFLNKVLALIPDEKEINPSSQFHCMRCGQTWKRENVKGKIVYSDGVCSRCQDNEKEIAQQERTDIGEGLCVLIGNLMLQDMEAGKLLGEQLEPIISRCKTGNWQALQSGKEVNNDKP